MTFDPLLSSFIIAALVLIGAVVIFPVVRPLFSPVFQLIMHPEPGQKYVMRGILGVGILAFVALLIAAVTFMTRTDTLVTPDAIDALPTTFPEETPVP